MNNSVVLVLIVSILIGMAPQPAAANPCPESLTRRLATLDRQIERLAPAESPRGLGRAPERLSLRSPAPGEYACTRRFGNRLDCRMLPPLTRRAEARLASLRAQRQAVLQALYACQPPSSPRRGLWPFRL